MLLRTEAAPDAQERANIEHSLEVLRERFPDVPPEALTVGSTRPRARWCLFEQQQDLTIGEARYLAPPDSVRLYATDPEADLHSDDAPRRLERSTFYLLTRSDLYNPLRAAGEVVVAEGAITLHASALRAPSSQERESGIPKSALIVGRMELSTPAYTYDYRKGGESQP